MGSFVKLAETYHLRLAGERLTLYKRAGESYEHVLMKALGYAMFRPVYPQLEIERRLGLRYKPDLVALDATNQIEFWGECGAVSFRKIAWLAKHSSARRIVIFKFANSPTAIAQWVASLQSEVEPRYRPIGQLSLINFQARVAHEVEKEINNVPSDWYSIHAI
ncbi:MAG TPA: YaeQ family protein [Blastocatellia bacterium]|nr:YaeQ family protein [Blastocatellia bacterium]